MNKLMTSARNFLREEDGVTAIEYGLLAALIAVAMITGAKLLGDNLNILFTALGNCMSNLPNACVLP
jgi:pilus assembly protein Flp/PilA